MYISVPTQRGVPTTGVPTRTYHCVYTYAYMQVPVLPTHARGLVRGGYYEGYLCGALLRIAVAAPPCSLTPAPSHPPLHLILRERVPARERPCVPLLDADRPSEAF